MANQLDYGKDEFDWVHMKSGTVDVRIKNAWTFASANDNFLATQQFLTLGGEIANAHESCKNAFERFCDWIAPAVT